MVRLVEEREVDLGEVGDREMKRSVDPGALYEPLCDGQSGPSGPRRADDDGQCGHVNPFSVGARWRVGISVSGSATASVPGDHEETSSSLETRRRTTTAANATATIPTDTRNESW